jgi:hypothetical protein
LKMICTFAHPPPCRQLGNAHTITMWQNTSINLFWTWWVNVEKWFWITWTIKAINPSDLIIWNNWQIGEST